MAKDYIFPSWVAKALRKPSLKTQYEATMIGTIVTWLVAVASTIYIALSGSLFVIITSILGVIGLTLLFASMLVTTYAQYYYYKFTNGLYTQEFLDKMNGVKNV